MTLTEKLGQLTMTACGQAVTGPTIAGDSSEAIKSGAIGNLLNLVGTENVHAMQRLAVDESRLGIPLLIGYDVIHGQRILFPIPLGEASTFDPKYWASSAREAAREAAADGVAMTFAPMLDVARDPRWGRIAEAPGEDPLVGARMAEAKVQGFQGADLLHADALAACAKHYCAYGCVTAGRDYAPVDISERTLHEVHMVPFAAAVSAGVAAIMPAFTDLNGIPMTAHHGLLREWLRGRFGFDGVVISDYNAIAELIRHGIAADLPEAAALALKAGVDIDMMADAYRHGLPVALKRGTVSIGEIDASVRRVLILKERLGLFDDPYRRGKNRESSAAVASRRQLAREIAAHSIVMLKNDKDVLPISAEARRVAVIGPLANASAEMRGVWWGAAPPEGHVTVLDGLRAALPHAQILHAEGVEIESADFSGIAGGVDHCAVADAVILCLGEAAVMSGEASSRAHLGLPGIQRRLAEAVFERAQHAGVPVIVVLFSGRPLVVPWLVERADAVLAAWFLGSEAGNAIADVLTARVSPSGRTPVTWPRAAGQVPIFFSERPSGRPFDRNDRFTSKYLDVANDPLFPFGFGLSYGRFELSNLRLSAGTMGIGDTLIIQVDVANLGSREAQETVFLFAHDKIASVSRPKLELKGFGKITLSPGKSGTVGLSLRGADLCFLGLDLTPVFEIGEVEILVGPCADRSQLLAATVQLVAT
ncbi:MAG TPA: glycoside hydrolase family 3 N-terminal domain-containing protein [Steroidobacteraceae bacterium]|jgi:beta-glucosidase|nr:glycoside hydrolase family 3 N-terminal domain-containing protein [Steroidobacteraceae bacterium]